MLKELISRYSRVAFPSQPVLFPPTHQLPSGAIADWTGAVPVVKNNFVAAFNKEVAVLGYTFDKDVLDRLGQLDNFQFIDVRRNLLPALEQASGSTDNHAALYNKFPYDTPAHDDYLMRRIFGHFQTLTGKKQKESRVLSCGHIIDPRLFKLEDFSACPICQFQVPELLSHDEAVHAYKQVTPLKVLSFADNEFVRKEAGALLRRGSSLSATEKAFLGEAIATVPLADVAGGLQTVYRETLPFVYDIGVEFVVAHLTSATDVLRIAYHLSSPDADLSLKENVRFKMSNRHKRALMTLLEIIHNKVGLTEDMMRNRERWLRLGYLFHAGSGEVRKRYPGVWQAFLTLRNAPNEIVTFNRIVEQHIRSKQVEPLLLRNLLRRPGEFLRRIDWLLRTAEDPAPVLATLEQVLPNARLRMLMEVSKYLEHRKTATNQRAFLPKGNVNKMQLVDDTRAPINANILGVAKSMIDFEVFTRLSKRSAMGTVYIDDSLKGIIMPFNKRGDSDTSVSVIKGSKYPVTADTKVVRLFVHWTGRDVDLSMMGFNAQMNYVMAVSFRNTKESGCIHSGDVQDAYNGATEFIDMDIDMLRMQGVRYAVASVIAYSGEKFNTFPCYAGFMERDKLRSGVKFEPSSVALKFDVNAPGTMVIPLIFDIDTMEVIFVDLTCGGGRHSFMDGQHDKVSAVTKYILDIANRKLTVHDVLYANAKARGEIVGEPDAADVKFITDGMKLIGHDIETLADDFLADDPS